MALLERGSRPLSCSTKCATRATTSLPLRPFTTTSPFKQETIETTPTAPSHPKVPKHDLRPERLVNIVHSPRSERRLIRVHGLSPIGSRRRRAAIATSPNIPFHQLPYQCFQEARKFIQEDRAEKVEEIEQQRRRIQGLKATIAQNADGWEESNQLQQEHRLRSMKRRLDEVKILADINDPIVKKKFEDGFGDMNKPIYRHLADLKWRSYKRKVLMQRITQMNVIPDILPHLDPTVSTSLSFGGTNVQHGEIMLSTLTQKAPTLVIQPFDKGERWITVAVVNPDVPNVEKDGFDYRCHFLASNIRISPTQTRVDLANLDPETQVIQDWLPAYAQKGLSYQRMGIFVFEQEPMVQDAATRDQTRGMEMKLATIYKISNTADSTSPAEDPSETSPSRDPLSSTIVPVPDIKDTGRYTQRPNFILRSFSTKYNLKPVGVDLFRTQWDEGTAMVMRRLGLPGWDVEFKRKKVEPLPYQRLKGERYR